MRSLAAAVAFTLLAGCSCDRGGGLSGQAGELVVVVPSPSGEVLTRQALVTLEPVVMDESGDFEVRLRNIGSAPLTVAAVTKQGGSDALSLDGAPGLTIPRDGEVTLAAHFAPPTDADVTKATVEHRADFQVSVSGGRPGEEIAAITLAALAVARDCYVPEVLDFGEVPLGQHVTLPFVLENGKPFPATTEVAPIEGDDAAFFGLVTPGPFEVNPGQRVEVPVAFGPLEERAYAATVRVKRAPTCAEGITRLVGQGSSQAVAWSPAMVDFGRVPLNVAMSRQVTVVNGTGAPLALEGLVADGAAYALVNPPSEVPARGSVTFTVTCKPLALGRVEGTLRFDVATVERIPARVPLTCVGGAPRIRLTPSPALSFGDVPLGGATSRRLSVQNVGTPPAFPGDVSNNLVLGVGGQAPFLALVPASTATKVTDFEISLPAGYAPAVGLPAVAGLNTMDLDVRLVGTNSGRKEADLLVYSNDPVQPIVSVRVSANPVAPGTCNLSITPSVLAMGDIPRGATFERSVTVTGELGTRGCLVSMDLAPGSAPALAIDPVAPFTLDAGASRTVKVRATADPSLPFGTTARGFVRVQGGVDPPVLVPVEMRVANCLVLAPPALELGNTKVSCRSGSKAIHAYNVCGVPVLIDGIDLRPGGTPFVFTSTVPIPSGGLPLSSGAGPLTTQVAFAPPAVGPAAGTVDFRVREAGVARTLSVALNGTGDLLGLQTDVWQQVGAGKMDILFVVDDSCSMGDEQASLAGNFASFIAAVNQGTVDYHLGVTTTDLFRVGGRLVGSPSVLTSSTPGLNQAFASNVLVGTSGSGFEQPFEAAARALTEPLKSTANAGFLRSDASLAIVMVTDAVEQSTGAVGAYLSTYRQAKGGKANLVSVNVVGPFSPPSVTCSLDSTVDDGRFADIITQSNGVEADICTRNWAQDLASIGQSLVQPRLTFELTAQPENPSTIQVRVDGAVVTNWTYRASTNSIVFPSSGAPPAGSTVTATYGTACY